MSSPKRIWLRQETVLLGVIVLEWLAFNASSPRFATLDNQFDILRHSVEIGLLALVMTPVIITGGIDLSVGSLLGLSAVVFGKLWRDGGLPLPAAATLTLGFGALAGGLNATLITALRLPPLIVTLGTYSLFRGLAEALTRGVDAFTDFPAGFLVLGQERWLGVPAQAPVFAVVALGMWVLVHRTVYGRSFRAMGHAPEGARFAGIPVDRRLALAYVLAGTATVEYDGGVVKTYPEGTAFMEAIGTQHNGRNLGTTTVRILVTFMGAEGANNTVKL